MLFLGRISRWWRNRSRDLFVYHDGVAWRRADPLFVGRRLEKVEPEYQTLLSTIHEDVSKLPPGPIREALQRDQNGAAVKLMKVAREVFGLQPLDDAGGVTDGEALGVLTRYFLFMEDLADAAGFTSTPPATG